MCTLPWATWNLKKTVQSSLMDPAQEGPAREKRPHGKGQESTAGREEMRGKCLLSQGRVRCRGLHRLSQGAYA